jgi:hypothetical protein
MTKKAGVKFSKMSWRQLIKLHGWAYVKLEHTWSKADGRKYPKGWKNNGGFVIRYGIKGFGFGEIIFRRRLNGTIFCDSEMMSREFVNAALKEIVRQSKFDWETND